MMGTMIASLLKELVDESEEKQQQRRPGVPYHHHPLHPLGPPEALNSIPCNTTKTGYRRSQNPFSNPLHSEQQQQHPFQVRRLSHTPHIFHLSNFLSETERMTLLWSTRNDPKEVFYYAQNNTLNKGRMHCHVSWLKPYFAQGLSGKLAQDSARLVFSEALHTGKGGAGQYEQLQIVRYTKAGKFDLHHDLAHRAVTVLYYLNGVAGTWFPLAQQAPQPPIQQSLKEHLESPLPQPPLPQPHSLQEALDLIKSHKLTPEKDGILVVGNGSFNSHNGDHDDEDKQHAQDTAAVVHIQPGDAIVFYNYDTTVPMITDSHNQEFNTKAKVDWRAIHAGLPVLNAPEKCIATHWFQGGDFVVK